MERISPIADQLHVESEESCGLLYGGRPGALGPAPHKIVFWAPCRTAVVQLTVFAVPSEFATVHDAVQLRGAGQLLVA